LKKNISSISKIYPTPRPSWL